MKFTLPRLQLGDLVQARLVERIDSQHWIADFHGDLVRVFDRSQTRFQPGDRVTLKVIARKPLGFQLFEGHKGSSRNWAV